MRTRPAVVAMWLSASMSASCERSRSADTQATVTLPATVDASTIVDGGAGASVPRIASVEARASVATNRGVELRQALDEVVRRIDRGERPERVAAVLGTVTKGADGQILVKSTQPWASSVWLRADDQSIDFDFTTSLRGAEVNAGVGPCHLTILLGDFGDGSGVTCPDIETRRGTMRLQGTAQPLDGRELDDGIVDSFAFYWTRRR